MDFFFPDAQDLVDPSFDFETERRSVERLRQRDDVYAHEVFGNPPFDGILVSKGIVDGYGPSSSRYSLAQRQRLLRSGAREFFRLANKELRFLGDCGAFTYHREETPPFSVDDVLSFYVECGFDLGVSVDHVILDYKPGWDEPGEAAPAAIKQRQTITLELAAEFLKRHHQSKLGFVPLGVAQGWSPKSYAASVRALQKMGFQYIALGGMVPLKTTEILACLEAIGPVRKASTRFHLLGVTRLESILTFQDFGVASFDSTSPLRQAFKDDKDNYYTLDRAYTAVRVPQVEGNPSLQKKIRAGQIHQGTARGLEKACLRILKRYDAGDCSVEDAVKILHEYEQLYDPAHDHSNVYREVLAERPWAKCGCDVCRTIGYHTILFRGAERNRRRGFHNVWVFYQRLHRGLGAPAVVATTAAKHRTHDNQIRLADVN